MTNPIETITVESLPVISYQNVRLITSDLLAQLYKTDVKNIQMNFTRNAGRFEPDKHYFKLEGETLRQFKRFHKPTVSGFVEISPRVKHLTLWTERGAARHAKMLDTEQAWEVFEKLEDAYFAPQPPALPDDTLPKDVRAAINRRAHALSLRHYDRIRDDITAALRRHLKRYPEDRDLVAYVEGVDLPDSALVTLHRSDLWEITSRFAAIEVIVSHEMEAIHRLDATTGQHWYSR